MERNQQNIDPSQADKVTWLAKIMFTAYPEDATGLKFYTLDCGCIYYQRVLEDGDLDTEIGIYRDAKGGPCEICLLQEKAWKDRVLDETVVYKSWFQIEFQ